MLLMDVGIYSEILLHGESLLSWEVGQIIIQYQNSWMQRVSGIGKGEGGSSLPLMMAWSEKTE